MDDERFIALYRIVRLLSPRRAKRCQYSDGDILLIVLWAALRHKPISWAADPRNVPRVLRGRPIPSRTVVGRRADSPGVDALIHELIRHFQARLLVGHLVGCWKIDAKGFAVSRYSKDKHARWGYCREGKARGYKLFLLTDTHNVPIAWRVEAMNVAESTVARELIEAIDVPGYLLGDSAYDANALYEQAAAKQVQLIAPRKQPQKPIGQRARSASRLHAIAMLETPLDTFGRRLYQRRTDIERTFARWSASAVGLDHLPGWVRTPRRVRRWINAKICLALANEF